MSGLGLWNLARKPDKIGVIRDKTERPDMSGLGADMSGQSLCKPA
jgi:hypothetical protein